MDLAWSLCLSKSGLAIKEFELSFCAGVSTSNALPSGFVAEVTPLQKLSTYQCRETVGLCHILKWSVYVGVDLSKTNWLAVKCVIWQAQFYAGKARPSL